MQGRIHSFQSMGAVDGPGLRSVVFMQGCPLRCIYCHNPDTWDSHAGQIITTDELISKILRFKPYFAQKGGVTLSGGEPLLQADFTAELFAKLQRLNIHTALDTCGHGTYESIDKVLCHTDLVLCDVKFPTEEQYRKHADGSLHQVLDFLAQANQRQIPIWIRHVVVPGLTDNKASFQTILDLVGQFSMVKKIELLPFRKLCEEKYRSMNMIFPLQATPECSADTIEQLSSMLAHNSQ